MYSDSSNTYGYSTNTFIFSLINKEGLAPVKSMAKRPKYAIYRNGGYGPTFGGGYDIHISHNANSNTNSYTNFITATTTYQVEYRTGKQSLLDPTLSHLMRWRCFISPESHDTENGRLVMELI